MSYPTFSFNSTGEEAATAFAEQIKGKNVLITGTTKAGLGLEVARVIGKNANLVIITGYNATRLKESEEYLKKEVPSVNVRAINLDLSSLAEVRKTAAIVNAYPEPIHVLINNAAAPFQPMKLTVDGLESHMAVDQVGPFLFTKLIFPKILASTTPSYTPRVIYLSSTGHAFGPGVNLETVKTPDASKYEPFDAYGQGKAANAMMAFELAKRAGGKVHAFSLCPGLIYTNIHQRDDAIPIMQAAGFLGPDKKPSTEKFDVWKPLPQGAATIVVAAFDPRITDQSGSYLSNGVVANNERAPHASDPARTEQLWNITEEIIGEKWEV